MSVGNIPFSGNNSAVKRFVSICYNDNHVTSQGVFLHDNPFDYPLPLALFEIPLIFLSSSLVHRLLRPLSQPRVASQILAGILLGRSAIGRSTAFQTTIFPPRGTFVLDVLSLVSLFLFLFSIGVRTDLSILKKPGMPAVVIGLAASALPFFLSLALTKLLRRNMTSDLTDSELLFELFLRLSLSSYPVVADGLDELGLLNSDLGRTAMSATLITDILNWIISTVFIAYNLVVHADSPMTAFFIVASLLSFVAAVVFIARPTAAWLLRRTPPGHMLSDWAFIAAILPAFLAAFVTEVTGFASTLGPFILGLALPGGMPLGVTITNKLDSFLSRLFLPLYLVLAGYRTDFSKVHSVKSTSILVTMFAVCYIGKLAGAGAGAAYFKMPFRDALTIGLMLNIRGIIEVSFFNGWGDTQLATGQHFSVLMITLLLNTAVTNPLVKILYDPRRRYVALKRRTVQHARPGGPLRVLSCVHNADQVNGILELLEATGPTRGNPISVFVLHLTEIAGQAASVLRPFKLRRASGGTPTGRVMNAFRYLEMEREPGSLSIYPYLSIAPTATMHNDVCSLALDKKARIILLPFHKHSDGAGLKADHSVRSVNIRVLDYAPCSTAVLIDPGLPAAASSARTSHSLRRVAVYFIGGADDREALAYGMRMARVGGAGLSVTRFFSKGGEEIGGGEEEGRMDEEVMEELKRLCAEREKVVYGERVVENGEGTVAVMRAMSEKFDLVIVGRRKGLTSYLTKGLSVWSECPELGLVGDMLASTEFAGKVYILVVEQQVMAGRHVGRSVLGSRKGVLH